MSVGDKPGHPFRGNQYESGGGMRGTHTGEIIKRGREELHGIKIDDPGRRDMRADPNLKAGQTVYLTGGELKHWERQRGAAPDLDHLSRENKLPAKVSDVPTGGRGEYTPTADRPAASLPKSGERMDVGLTAPKDQASAYQDRVKTLAAKADAERGGRDYTMRGGGQGRGEKRSTKVSGRNLGGQRIGPGTVKAAVARKRPISEGGTGKVGVNNYGAGKKYSIYD